MIDNTDINVKLDTLDKSMDDNNMFLYTSTPIETELKEVNNTDKYINTISPTHYMRGINKNYYKIDNKPYINPYKEFLEYINGYRNIYMSNDYAGSIRCFYNQQYENEPEKAAIADYVFTPNEYTYPYNDIHYFNSSPMVYAKVVDYIRSDEQKYIVNKSLKYTYNYKHECLTNKYNVYRIPHDLLNMFTHITKYWGEIKNTLTLDKETGYYCYVPKDNKTISIPIICKHQAMILDNISINIVSAQCYINGVCKFCGQEIIAYNDGNDFVLPTTAMSLIINFSEIFTHKYSADMIIFDVTNYIIRRLQDMKISNYSNDECIGWTCLILIKLCQLGNKQFAISDAKFKKLINKLSKNLSILGKSDKDIDDFLNDNSLFEGIDNLIIMLQSDGIVNKQSNDDINKIITNIDKIIFDGNDKTPKTQLQKYYLSNDGKIYEMFLAFKLLLCRAYNTPFKYIVNEIIRDIDDETINNTVNTFGYDFFRKTAKIYCPVNSCHEWKNNICKYCGLHKDLSNIEEIYNKYSTEINNVNTESPNLMTTDIKEAKRDYKQIINDIKKTDYKQFDDIIKKYVNFDYMNELNKLTVKKSKIYLETAAMSLNIPFDILNENLNNDDDMKRLCCYILSKQDEAITINNIIACLLHVVNPLEFIVKD